jgi:hypothetical protein
MDLIKKFRLLMLNPDLKEKLEKLHEKMITRKNCSAKESQSPEKLGVLF